MTEQIFGRWDTMPLRRTDDLDLLWHKLAAQSVGSHNFKPNSGMSQRRHEICMLWSLFARQRPKLIMEVGVAQGATLAGWCQLAPDDATIIAVDRCLDDCRPRPGDPVHPDISGRSDLSTSKGGGIHHLRRGNQQMLGINGWTTDDSTKAAIMEALAGRKVDFLYHDASHSKELFALDFAFFWPLVVDGGVFATHDVMPSNAPNCDKSEEWERIKREESYSACYQFFSSRTEDSMGQGVLIK